MIDYEQAMSDQEDLKRLIDGITDDMLREPFKFNDSYGFAGILKAYSGHPAEQPINAVIPHGVYFNASLMLDIERDSGLPAVLNYPAYRADVWRESGFEVVASASPYLYALELFRARFGLRDDATGTLFFPAHTVQTLRVNTDWRKVAEELSELDAEYQPVTVCAHPVDYLKGLYDPLARAGFKIVSAGNTFDPEFIFRWLHLLSGHRYAASNDVGGAALYASRAGLPVLVLEQIGECYADPSLYTLPKHPGTAQAKATKNAVIELFRSDPLAENAQRAETVAYLLGAENLKPPQDLRADLEYVAGLGR